MYRNIFCYKNAQIHITLLHIHNAAHIKMLFLSSWTAHIFSRKVRASTSSQEFLLSYLKISFWLSAFSLSLYRFPHTSRYRFFYSRCKTLYFYVYAVKFLLTYIILALTRKICVILSKKLQKLALLKLLSNLFVKTTVFSYFFDIPQILHV